MNIVTTDWGSFWIWSLLNRVYGSLSLSVILIVEVTLSVRTNQVFDWNWLWFAEISPVFHRRTSTTTISWPLAWPSSNWAFRLCSILKIWSNVLFLTDCPYWRICRSSSRFWRPPNLKVIRMSTCPHVRMSIERRRCHLKCRSGCTRLVEPVTRVTSSDTYIDSMMMGG